VEEGFVPPHRGPIGPLELVQEGTEELHVGPQSRERFLQGLPVIVVVAKGEK